MPHRATSALLGLAALTLAGCEVTPPSYLLSFVAANSDATPVLMLTDQAGGNPTLSTVDIETGKRGTRHELGARGFCAPSVPGRLWCAHEDGLLHVDDAHDDYVAGAHEARRVSTFALLADDQTIADASDGALSRDDVKLSGTQAIVRRSDFALVIDKGDAYFTVHPGTFAVSPSPLIYGSATTYSGEQVSAAASFATLGATDYQIDDDEHLQSAPMGTETWTTLGPESYRNGRIVETDVYKPEVQALTAPDPQSIFLLSTAPDAGSDGGATVLTRVAIEDGKVIWQRALTPGFVHAIAGQGEVLGLVVETTLRTGMEDANTVIHATLLGISMAKGADVWTLEI